MHKKRIAIILIISIALLLVCQTAYAAPAYSGIIQVTDKNGKKLAIRNHGDEFFSYQTDVEGNLILSDKDGLYYYIVYEGEDFAKGDVVGAADIQQDTRQRVKAADDLDSLKEKLTELRNTLEKPAVSMFILEDNGAYVPSAYPDNYMHNANTKDPLYGVWRDTSELPPNPTKAATCPLLVLKISFADVKCLFTDAEWHKRVFDDGVADYYTKVSNGKFTYVPAEETFSPEGGYAGANDGVIHITMPIDHPEYRYNHTGQNYSLGARAGIYTATIGEKELEFAFVNDASLIAYALKYADEYIDFSRYDRNGDGFVSPTEMAVMAVVAGYEASMGAAADQPKTWGHSYRFNTFRYSLSETDEAGEPVVIGNAGCIELDGKKLYQYTAVGENMNVNYSYDNPSQDNPPAQATIGTVCHELAHDLGLKDLYDTTYSLQKSEVLTLSLMAQGNFGFDPSKQPLLAGNSPTLLDPYSKIYLGFYDETVVTEGGLYYLSEASNSPEYNILRINTEDPNIYYLIENRTLTGYDVGLYFCNELGQVYDGGLVYWRIDQAVVDAKWENNSINVTSGSYGIMPEYVSFYVITDEGGKKYIDMNPFHHSATIGFPIEGSNKELFSLDPISAKMPLWINPLPINIAPVASFVQGMAGDTTFTINQGNLKPTDLVSVLVDGKELTLNTQYTAESGSIIIRIKQDYLNTLAPGVYPVQANLTHGWSAATYLRVTGRTNAAEIVPPKTGDTATPLLWAGLALLSGAGAIIIGLSRRRSVYKL